MSLTPATRCDELSAVPPLAIRFKITTTLEKINDIDTPLVEEE